MLRDERKEIATTGPSCAPSESEGSGSISGTTRLLPGCDVADPDSGSNSHSATAPSAVLAPIRPWR